MQYSWRARFFAIPLIFLCISSLQANADVEEIRRGFLDVLASTAPSREEVIEHISQIEDPHELLSVLKEEVTSGNAENRRRIIFYAIRTLAVLAIDGRDDVRQGAVDYLVELFRNPSITLTTYGSPLQPDDESHMIELITALGELGNEAAVSCLADGTRFGYWKEEATPNPDQGDWHYAAIEHMMENAFHNLYFLQGKFAEAEARMNELRNADPTSQDKVILHNALTSFDNGTIPGQVLVYLRIRESFRPPFYKHPGVDVYLQSQSSVRGWTQLK